MHQQPEHDERYRICEEYMTVMYKLWNSSWRSDAVVRDTSPHASLRGPPSSRRPPDYPTPSEGVYTRADRVREINHQGKYFTVPGPHICAPSPQRTPVIMQAGTSSAGQAFAASHAEAIFISGHSPASVAKSVSSIRARAASAGRDPQSIKFLAKMMPVLGRTQEEADAKYRDYLSYGSYEGALALFGGWTGTDMSKYTDDQELNLVESNAIRSYIEGLMKHAPRDGRKWTKRTLAEHIMVGGLGACIVGTPAVVADYLEEWVAEADVDGFNLCYAILPQSFVDVIELLVPELQRRGLFWMDYAVQGGTYRENLNCRAGQREPLADHPAAGYIWRAGNKEGEDEEEQVNGVRVEEKKSAGAGTVTKLSPAAMRVLDDRFATALSSRGMPVTYS